jgi:hypothetical protein
MGGSGGITFNRGITRGAGTSRGSYRSQGNTFNVDIGYNILNNFGVQCYTL